MPLEGMDVLEKVGVETPKDDKLNPPGDELPPEDELEPEPELELEPELEEEPDESTLLAEEGLRPTVAEINKEFPDFFKKFPEMRNMYFREAKYAEVFPTIEDANAAIADVEALRTLETQITSGKVEDVITTLETLKDTGEGVVESLAVNFLPALKSANSKAYYSAITPEILGAIRGLYSAGVKLGEEAGKNLRNSALVASLYYFEDVEYATGKKELNLPKPKSVDAVVSTVEKERSEFQTERLGAFFNDVNEDYSSSIQEAIIEGLDPDEVMTPYMKNVLAGDIEKRIDKALSVDEGHKRRMKALWNSAKVAGYTRNWKDRITTAALSRAKTIMPAIRSKARAEALSTKARQGERVTSASNKARRELPNTSTTRSSGSPSMRQIGNLDPKKIDWKSTSDLDLIQGKANLKK